MPNEQIDADISAEAAAMGLDESDLTGEAGGSFEQPITHQLDSEEEKSSEQPQNPVEEKKGTEDLTDNEDDEDGEEDPGKKQEDPGSKKNPAKEAFEKRQGKRRQEIEQLTNVVASQQAQISELTGLMKQALSPKTSTEDKDEAKADYKAKFQAFAEKNGIAPEDMENFSDAMVEAIAEKLGLTPEQVQKMTQATSFVEKKQAEDHDLEEKQIFETEWNGVVPNIQKTYPNASKEQLQQAQVLMDELAHSEEYGKTDKHPPMPLDYILFKESKKFGEILFSPKKVTAESGHVGDWDAPAADPLNFNYENLTPESAAKAEAEIDALYNKKPQ